MRSYPYHDREAHQKSIEIQRRIKKNVFKGQRIDWRSIPAVVDDGDGPHIAAFSGSPLSCCNTIEKTLEDFRLPNVTATSASDADAAGELEFYDTIF